MSTLAEMVVRIGADVTRFQRGIKVAAMETAAFNTRVAASGMSVGRSIDAMGAKTRGLGKTIQHTGAMWSIALIPLALAVKGGIAKLGQLQAANVQTSSVIHSLGSETHLTTTFVRQMSQSLGDLAGVVPESVQAGETLLLTLQKFPGTLQQQRREFANAALDMENYSVRMKVGPEQAARMLSKAQFNLAKDTLQVGRSTIHVSDSMARLGVHYQKTRNDAGKLALMHKALTEKMGGAAAAAGSTFPAKMERMTEALKLAEANLATVLLPLLTQVVEKVTAAAKAFDTLSPSQKRAAATTGALALVMAPVAAIAGTLVRGVGLLISGFGKLIGVAFAVGGAISEVYSVFAGGAGALGGVASAVETVALVVMYAAEAIGTAIAAVAAVIGAPVEIIIAAIVAIAAAAVYIVVKWRSVVALLRGVFSDIEGVFGSAFSTIEGAVTSALDSIENTARGIFNSIAGVFRSAWSTISSLTVGKVAEIVAYVAVRLALLPITVLLQLNRALQAFLSAIPGWVSAALSLASSAVHAIASGLRALPRIVGGAASSAAHAIAAAVSRWASAAASLASSVVHAIGSGLKALPGVVMDALAAIIPAIIHAAQSAGKAAHDVGSSIVSGIAGGIKDAAGAAASAAAGAASGALNAAKDALSINSPSKKAYDEIGIPFSHGIAAGIRRGKALTLQAAADVAQGAVDAAQAKMDTASRLRDLADAKLSVRQAHRTKDRSDDISAQRSLVAANQAIRMAKLSAAAAAAQARVNKLAAAISGLDNADTLASNNYGLSVALAGGTASIQQQADRIAELRGEYTNLSGFLQANMKNLGVDQQSSIVSNLTGMINEINSINDANPDLGRSPSAGNGGGLPGSGDTVTATVDRQSGVARVVVNQNFIGPNVDHFSASRSALFEYQTAGLAPAP